jgi:hypothetical protein
MKTYCWGEDGGIVAAQGLSHSAASARDIVGRVDVNTCPDHRSPPGCQAFDTLWAYAAGCAAGSGKLGPYNLCTYNLCN